MTHRLWLMYDSYWTKQKYEKSLIKMRHESNNIDERIVRLMSQNPQLSTTFSSSATYPATTYDLNSKKKDDNSYNDEVFMVWFEKYLFKRNETERLRL